MYIIVFPGFVFMRWVDWTKQMTRAYLFYKFMIVRDMPFL